MSCLLANGRAEACKDSIGGLKNVYFANFDIEAADITYDGTDTDLITAITGIGSLYKYELKGNSTFVQNINSSRENGTTFFEQVLTLELKAQDAATTKNIKLLSYGRPHIVVETNDGQYFIAGLLRGMDVTGGEISNGTALGDFNGYKLTFTGQEKTPANHLDCTTEAALATLFATSAVDATIVTS
jgi:hypothetical protein